jgi:hypothetical protein
MVSAPASLRCGRWRGSYSTATMQDVDKLYLVSRLVTGTITQPRDYPSCSLFAWTFRLVSVTGVRVYSTGYR